MAEAARELRPLYKKLLRLAQSLPEPKRQQQLDQIRREFRSHGDVTDPQQVSALIQRAQSSLGYLKIVTPRAESNTGVQRFIYRNGQRVDAAELEAKGEENARYKTQDMEAGLKRHHQLLRRQYFMDRKSGPPRPIF
ncbi:Complex 1 LYR protein [Phytophthora cinnamomi]|uniref:Complex 1 LYR protein n=1 Tax=Phytophthora cinnamomi TaxID=4785 RepID=UPI003559D08F|nr:Complex 1 LYR protein [Phytophthora cinnamomi]